MAAYKRLTYISRFALRHFICSCHDIDNGHHFANGIIFATSFNRLQIFTWKRLWEKFRLRGWSRIETKV
jgi:hypothetical protein